MLRFQLRDMIYEMDLPPCGWKLESISLFFNRSMNLERTNLFIIKLLERISSIKI